MSTANENNITRRHTLGALASIAASIPRSVIASSMHDGDPIFPAIEAHRHAAAAFSASVRNEPSHKTLAHDKWERGTFSAGDHEIEATEALFSTQPTTAAGALALLRYVHEVEERGVAGELLMHEMSADNAGYAFNALVATLIVTLAPMVLA